MSRHLTRKILWITGITIIALAVLAGGGAAALYWHGVRQNQPIEQLSPVTLAPKGSVELGQNVTASVLLKCPWHRRPVEAVAAAGKGSSIVETPEMSRQKIGLGYSIWKVSTEFKPYRIGSIPAGKLEVKFNRYNKNTRDHGMNFRIPEITVRPIPLGKNQQLRLADKIEEPPGLQPRNYYLWGGIALAALLALGVILWLRQRGGPGRIIITPWGTALLELADLRTGIKSGKIKLDVCFGKLTDIVREYLEKRFKLHAPQQTTYEFLNDINQADGPLPEKHRPFLGEFMTAADLVKFAKLPPDENILNNALDKAEKLVGETRPDAQENSNGGKK